MLRRLRSLVRALAADLSAPVNPTKNAGCAKFEVDCWAVSEFVLRKLVPVVGVHPFPLHELMLMVAATCHLRPSMIFDWGTHEGRSARIFYECIRHYGIAAQIHSTDLPGDVSHVEHPGSARGVLVKGLANVHLHQGDGVETSLEIWRAGGRTGRAMFFLDGDHSYASVLRELTAISKEVPDATILVHDAFYQDPQSGYNTGPHQAIEATLAAIPGRYSIVHSGLGLPGMTLMCPQRAMALDPSH